MTALEPAAAVRVLHGFVGRDGSLNLWDGRELAGERR